MQGKNDQSQKHGSLKMNFMCFFLKGFFLCCWFTTLAKDSRNAWSLLGSNVGGVHHLVAKKLLESTGILPDSLLVM